MSLKTTTESNYLAKVVKLKDGKKHDNADRLMVYQVDYQNVITGLDAENKKYVFFPALSVLDPKLLHELNLYSDSALNSNTSIKGYISSSGKIKATKLRGVKSEGVCIPVDELCKVYQVDEKIFTEDTYFDTIGSNVISWKYEAEDTESKANGVQKSPRQNKLAHILIPGVFRFHEDTPHLKRNIHLVQEGDVLEITHKLHGSSCILAHVPVRKHVPWYKRILRFFGKRIQDTEYAYIWSSGKPRSRLPKGISTGWKSPTQSYYTQDIWKDTMDRYQDKLPKGITVYGEIVGTHVQKGYDYKEIPHKFEHDRDHKFYVYKVTRMLGPGYIVEIDVKDFCKEYGFEPVPTLGNLVVADVDTVIEDLTAEYLEKDLPNGLPDEGICVKVQRTEEVYKLKSFKFTASE